MPIQSYLEEMRHHVLWAALLWASTSQALSQTTVEAADLPQAGEEHTFQNVSLQMPFDYEAAGPGWVWDFTELEVLDSTVIEVENFINANPFVLANLFGSGSDHFYPALNIPDFGGGEEGLELPIELDDVMGYHQVGSGTYNQVGLSINLSGIPLSTAFDDVDEMYPVPLTADASLESTASYALEILFPVVVTYAVDQQRSSTVDGYGTLLLPDGTSHEVLRLKSTVVSNDSVYVEFEGEGQGQSFVRETVTYAWIGDGGMPWMEVTELFGFPTVLRYQGAAPSEDNEPIDRVVERATTPAPFPNPTRVGQTIQLGGEANEEWTVHHLSGEEVMRFKGTTLTTANWSAGVYLLRNSASGQIHKLLVH